MTALCFEAITNQIEAADLPASVYRTARRLLDIAAGSNGTFSVPRAQMLEIAGTEADSTMRRHLIALSGAGIIEYTARERVMVMFTNWPEMITPRSDELPCSPDDPPGSPDEHGRDHPTRTGDHPVNIDAECSSGARGRSPDDPGRSLGAQNDAPIGNGWLDGIQSGTDNQPTNGAEPPKAPANNPPLEAKAVALLIDPSVGMATSKAKDLAQRFSFQEIRRQVFGWLPEFRRGGVKVGALVSRIQTGWACSEPDPEIDRKLWDRYRTPEEQAAEAQAQRELAEIVDRQHAEAKHRNGAKKPRPRAQPPPTYDDPWAIVVSETANQMPEGVLQRAHAESIGDLSGAEVWEVSLAMRDASHLSWMQDRGKELIRKSLSSVLGRAVKVDVIIPETEVA